MNGLTLRTATPQDRAFVERVYFATQRWLMLTLSTAKINPARRLYERLGFIVVAQTEFKFYMERRPRVQ